MTRRRAYLLPLAGLLMLASLCALPAHAQKIKGKGRPKSGASGTTAAPPADPEKERKQMEWLYLEACNQLLLENDSEAKANFLKVLEMEPRHGASHYNLSCILLRGGDTDAALRHAQQAVEAEPANYWYVVQVRAVQERKRDWRAALSTQESIARQFPKEKQALSTLADLYLQNGMPDAALSTLTKLESLGAFEESLSTRIAELLMGMDRKEDALVQVEKLIRNRPGNLTHLEAKYEILNELGRTSEATAVLEQMQVLDPENGFLLLTLADQYKARGDSKTSDQYLFRAMQSPNLDKESKLKIITGLVPFASRDNEVRQRVTTMARLVAAANPEDAQSQGILGDVMRMNGQRDSALVLYARSLELEPSNRSGWQQLLSLEHDMAKWEQVRKHGEEGLEYFPNEPAILKYFGIGSMRTGDTDAAIYAFEKLRKMSAGSPDALAESSYLLGQLYHTQGDHAKSDGAFQAALSSQPASHEAKNAYAYCLAERKERLEDAERMSMEALQAAPNVASYQDTHGWVLYQKGDYTGAAKWLEQAALSGGNALIFEHYADALVKLGNTGKAGEYYQKARAAGGDASRIETKLKSIQ